MERIRRFQDILQASLILFLVCILLALGSVSVNYMVKSAQSNAKYEILREENKQLVETLQTRMDKSVGEHVRGLENRLFTVEARVELLERKLRVLEQKQERP